MRRASHEFIITLKQESRTYQVTAMDVAKRLLDYGFHAPTTYFPLLVPECLLIEPTETETKEDLDRFCDAMTLIRRRNGARARETALRTAYNAGPAAGRRASRETARFGVEACSMKEPRGS